MAIRRRNSAPPVDYPSVVAPKPTQPSEFDLSPSVLDNTAHDDRNKGLIPKPQGKFQSLMNALGLATRVGGGWASSMGGPIGAGIGGGAEAIAQTFENIPRMGEAYGEALPELFAVGTPGDADKFSNVTGSKLKGFATGMAEPVARIGVETAVSSIPAASIIKGSKPLASAVRTGALTGVGETGREWARGEELDPYKIAGATGLGAVTGGILGKVLPESPMTPPAGAPSAIDKLKGFFAGKKPEAPAVPTGTPLEVTSTAVPGGSVLSGGKVTAGKGGSTKLTGAKYEPVTKVGEGFKDHQLPPKVKTPRELYEEKRIAAGFGPLQTTRYGPQPAPANYVPGVPLAPGEVDPIFQSSVADITDSAGNVVNSIQRGASNVASAAQDARPTSIASDVDPIFQNEFDEITDTAGNVINRVQRGPSYPVEPIPDPTDIIGRIPYGVPDASSRMLKSQDKEIRELEKLFSGAMKSADDRFKADELRKTLSGMKEGKTTGRMGQSAVDPTTGQRLSVGTTFTNAADELSEEADDALSALNRVEGEATPTATGVNVSVSPPVEPTVTTNPVAAVQKLLSSRPDYSTMTTEGLQRRASQLLQRGLDEDTQQELPVIMAELAKRNSKSSTSVPPTPSTPQAPVDLKTAKSPSFIDQLMSNVDEGVPAVPPKYYASLLDELGPEYRAIQGVSKKDPSYKDLARFMGREVGETGKRQNRFGPVDIPAAAPKSTAPVGEVAPDWVKSELDALDILKGQKGAVDPELLLAGLLTGGGALTGAALDENGSPIEGALAGGAAGLGMSGLVAAGRNQGVKDAIWKGYEAIPRIQRANYLTDAVGLPANAGIGPWSAAFTGGLEDALAGDPRGKVLMGLSKNPIDFIKKWKAAGPEAYRRLQAGEMGRAEELGMPGTGIMGNVNTTLALPGRAMTMGDVAAQDLMRLAGYTEPEARKMTMTNEAADKGLKYLQNMGKGGAWGPAIETMFPFKRTPINVLEQGAERLPGIGALIHALKGDADLQRVLAQQGISLGTAATAFIAGKTLPPDVAKHVKRVLTNASGRYALGTGLAFGAGQMMNAGDSVPPATRSKYMVESLFPLPTAEPISDTVSWLSGNGPIPRGATPALARQLGLFEDPATSNARPRIRRRRR